jgi:hypothetical protein
MIEKNLSLLHLKKMRMKKMRRRMKRKRKKMNMFLISQTRACLVRSVLEVDLLLRDQAQPYERAVRVASGSLLLDFMPH